MSGSRPTPEYGAPWLPISSPTTTPTPKGHPVNDAKTQQDETPSIPLAEV